MDRLPSACPRGPCPLPGHRGMCACVCMRWGRVGRGIRTDGPLWMRTISDPTAAPGAAGLQRWPEGTTQALPALQGSVLLLELTPASAGMRGVHLAPAPAMLGSPSLGTDSPSIQASA